MAWGLFIRTVRKKKYAPHHLHTTKTWYACRYIRAHIQKGQHMSAHLNQRREPQIDTIKKKQQETTSARMYRTMQRHR